MNNTEDKKQLRKLIAEKRDAMSAEELESRSALLAGRLFEFSQFKNAGSVMFFVGFRSEVRTLPIIKRAIREGKRVILPATIRETRQLLPCHITDLEKDLAPGVYDILEPSPGNRNPVGPEQIDFVCLPGLAFDRNGNRLGYGGGYYDRFIGSLRPDVTLAALAFSMQVIDMVPADVRDRKVRYIITEDEIISCGAPPPASPF